MLNENGHFIIIVQLSSLFSPGLFPCLPVVLGKRCQDGDVPRLHRTSTGGTDLQTMIKSNVTSISHRSYSGKTLRQPCLYVRQYDSNISLHTIVVRVLNINICVDVKEFFQIFIK